MEAVVVGRSDMSPVCQPEALFLVTQIVGSSHLMDSQAASVVGRIAEAELPVMAAAPICCFDTARLIGEVRAGRFSEKGWHGWPTNL